MQHKSPVLPESDRDWAFLQKYSEKIGRFPIDRWVKVDYNRITYRHFILGASARVRYNFL